MSTTPRGTVRALQGARCAAVFSRGLRRLPHLAAFLGVDSLVYRPSASAARGSVDAVVGWGHKPSAQAARRFAKQTGIPYVAVEDGFLRSVGLGHASPPLSLVLDDAGIYYDARQPSRLELLLQGPANEDADPLIDPALLERAQSLQRRIAESQVSKYNNSSTRLPRILGERSDWVLLVDQTFGDASIEQGLASAESFERLLAAALVENPDAHILLKVHPDTVAGKKQGHLYGMRLPDRVHVLDESTNPIALLKRTKHVYVCTSQLGFEALVLGKKVSCFGVPFYAGWGLTDDRLTIARRSTVRSVPQLLAAALILYPRYLHPFSHSRCEAEIILEHLALQRKRFEENARTYVCAGFSMWKRPFVRNFLSSPDADIRFVRGPRRVAQLAAQPNCTLLVWTTRRPPWLSTVATRHQLPIWNMEDGFLRSVQLGSDLSAPASLVVDREGIYYDPRFPSQLERILETNRFTGSELERAKRLRQQIVRSRVSKYNVGASPLTSSVQLDGTGPVIFVPGQVPDDCSVRHGSPRVQSDRELLQIVRTLRPEAQILYKPHPDVVSGNRRGEVPEYREALWDALTIDAPLHLCLDLADEVHTMTSLVGFEALLRSIPVVTHGQPFYAGWGLTRDECPPPRRGRSLNIDELVFGTLIEYPRYFDSHRAVFCEPEDVVEQLSRSRDTAQGTSLVSPWLFRRTRALMGLLMEWRRAF